MRNVWKNCNIKHSLGSEQNVFPHLWLKTAATLQWMSTMTVYWSTTAKMANSRPCNNGLFTFGLCSVFENLVFAHIHILQAYYIYMRKQRKQEMLTSNEMVQKVQNISAFLRKPCSHRSGTCVNICGYSSKCLTLIELQWKNKTVSKSKLSAGWFWCRMMLARNPFFFLMLTVVQFRFC